MKMPISLKIEKLILKTIRFLQSKVLGFNPNNKPCILCYHSISTDQWDLSVDPQEFEKQIRLLSLSRKVMPLRKLVSLNPKRYQDHVAITFDDGYEDVFTQALPIVKKFGFKAAVFVLGDDTSSNRGKALGNQKKLLTVSQIQELKKEGWDIGFHSSSHTDLRTLDVMSLKDEIVSGKTRLEKKLGLRVKFFSYPHGRYSQKIIVAVRQAGFKAAFTVDGGTLKAKMHPFKISRVIIDKYKNLDEFQTLLSDTGLYLRAILERILRLKDNKLATIYQ